MNNIFLPLIIFGHGIKPFGYAIIDELFPFFIKFSKIKINVVSILIILISMIILFQSVKGLIINFEDYLYKFHMIWISVCLFLLTMLNNDNLKIGKSFYIATTYLLINLIFVITQQINFFFSGGQLKCADLHHMTEEQIVRGGQLYQEDCFLDYAFWQDFWTGTAYSSLGLFISLILILSYLKKNNWKLLIISIFLFIIIFQESKTGLVYFFLLIPLIIIDEFKIQKFITIVLVIIILLSSDICFTYLNHLLGEYPNYNINYIVKKTFVYGVVSEISNILYSGDIAIFFDNGRINQLIGIQKYLVANNFFENLFGTYSGSHRFNLTNYIMTDNSGILRPIGIVVLIHDWGLLFLFIYILLVFYNLKNINKFFNQNKFKNSVILLIYLFISLNPLITNMNDSILFWYIIFFPRILLHQFIHKIKLV